MARFEKGNPGGPGRPPGRSIARLAMMKEMKQ